MPDTNVNLSSFTNSAHSSSKKRILFVLVLFFVLIALSLGIYYIFVSNRFGNFNLSENDTNVSTQTVDSSDIPEEIEEFFVIDNWKIAKFEPTVVDFTTINDQNFMFVKYNDVTFKVFLTGKINDSVSKDFVTYTFGDSSLPRDFTFLKENINENDKIGIYYFVSYSNESERTNEYCLEKFASFCSLAIYADTLKVKNKLITSSTKLSSEGILPAVEVYVPK